VPNYQKRLAQPVQTLFVLRPDLRTYLECGAAAGDPQVLAKSRANAEATGDNGSYWYQCAQLERQAPGGKSGAMEALQRSRRSQPHRFLPQCLDELARIYSEAGDHKGLRDVVLQRLQISVMLTPRMHRLMAQAWIEDDKVRALHHIEAGLDLPAAGFEGDVAALQELRGALKD